MGKPTETNPAENHAALAGYRVLDLTTPLGHLCGKIRGDLGADVIKIEPLAGDAGRSRSPFYKDPSGADHSLFWISYNNNKRGVTLNLESAEGQAILIKMVKEADFLLESYPPGYMDSLGLGFKQLSTQNPKLIHTAITPFGQSGPYRDFRGGDLEIMALSGVMSLTGHPGGQPLRISLSQSEAWASLYAAMGAITALSHRQANGGPGQFVDVSAQAACVILCAHAPWFWDYNREAPSRQGEFMTGRTTTGAKFRTVWPCKDGYLTFIIYGGPAGQKTNFELMKWMDSFGMAPDCMKKDWKKFDVNTITQPEVDEMETAFKKFFVNITKAEYLKVVAERGMLGYPVSSADDILADDQLVDRNFWQPLEQPGRDQPLKFPGAFAKFSGMKCGTRFRAPLLGEHNQAVYGDAMGFSSQEIARLHEAGVI
ncbi:MAG: CoA transferase [Acidobacteria bacterium]|nr:CoA transferase [Acidobacteriota bacterium]